jgi:RNA polymerase-binding transcription factor DksA
MRDTIDPNASFDTRIADFMGRFRRLDGQTDVTADSKLIDRVIDDALDALRMSADQKLRQIDAALARMVDGHYGFCENCNGEIALARLEQDPSTCFCAGCAA